MARKQEIKALDTISEALARATNIDQIKSLRDTAEALRTYSRAARLGLELQNRAAELKLRAERRAGHFLAKIAFTKGGRPSLVNSSCHASSLQSLGISKSQSSRWQRQALVPESVFQAYVQNSKEEGTEITAAGLLRIARRYAVARDQSSPTSHQQTVTVCRLRATGNRLQEPSRKSEILELLKELQDHRNLLVALLETLVEEGAIQLQSSERRMIPYLLSEIGSLLANLQSQFTNASR